MEDCVKNCVENYLWKPSLSRQANSRLAAFSAEYWAGHTAHFNTGGYDTLYDNLWQWSVNNRADFWRGVWQFCSVQGEMGGRILTDESDIKNARFFPDARLNYAQNLLARSGDKPALISYAEDGTRGVLSWQGLREQVSLLQQALINAGVKKGDRVGAILPNNATAISAMLATASLGAIWSSCSPDFGARGLLDRFGQIEPKVIFACIDTVYNGKDFCLTERLVNLMQDLPSVKKIVLCADKNPPDITEFNGRGILIGDFIADYHADTPQFEPMKFNDPAFILYSSGTTGLPKCIVHSHGGTLLQHLKEHQLQCDMKAGDRLLYFTTCGWMMWNWMVSALASKVCLVLVDGAPMFPDGYRLAGIAGRENVTHLGVSAKYLDACAKQNIKPKTRGALPALRCILSTGSPLSPAGFSYVYENWKTDVCLSSIAGGTDIIACFVGGSPLDAVYSGVCQKRHLAMEVAVFDENAHALKNTAGELVCTGPHPSQPVGFWRDADGAKYHAAYYARFENIWHHGDWVAMHPSGGMVFYGRSDAVLNPGGVRIGTAEIYRQVESMAEVSEAVVIGQNWDNDVRVILFVRLSEGAVLDEDLVARIKTRLRDNASPRHVPAKIISVRDIPRTKSGKITELAVRDVVLGRAVKNTEALANPESLAFFRGLKELGE